MHTHLSPAPIPRRVQIATAILALALLLLALICPAGAPARGTIAHRGACPAAGRHAGHAVRGGHCAKRPARHPKQAAHQPAKHPHPGGKRSHRSTPVPAPVRALCEDGSAPVLGGEGWACGDGSEPGCEDGGEPVAVAGGGTPVCRNSGQTTGEAPAECAAEAPGECAGVEFSCEGGVESGEAPAACESGPGG